MRNASRPPPLPAQIRVRATRALSALELAQRPAPLAPSLPLPGAPAPTRAGLAPAGTAEPPPSDEVKPAASTPRQTDYLPDLVLIWARSGCSGQRGHPRRLAQ